MFGLHALMLRVRTSFSYFWSRSSVYESVFYHDRVTEMTSRAATPTRSEGRRSFITEVVSTSSLKPKDDSDPIRLSERVASSGNRRQSVVRMPKSPPNPITATTSAGGASDVFRVIDKLSERHMRSKNIRTMIQKAAQKTILVVRTKNATQAAENVTIRFHPDRLTDTPRSVQLEHLSEKVLEHLEFASAKKKSRFYELFMNSSEIDAILKDLFWYFTAHCFQTGFHTHVEDGFYQRVADLFTLLFTRLQMKRSSRDCGFLDRLPDVMAQIVFMALYEAFPKSRKRMMVSGLRQQILHICFTWMLGFVPADLSCSHWISVDQESSKRIAQLAEFPAMRNRMLRAERVERTKQDVRQRHSSALENDDEEDDSRLDVEDEVLPSVSAKCGDDANGCQARAVRVETRERCVYQMRNSPLVDAFLKRHQLQSNASHLHVQLRLTSGNHVDLHNQEALHATTLPRERRRRIVNPKMYADALQQIERFGDAVRTNYASEKKQMHDRNALERNEALRVQQSLDSQLGELRNHLDQMHAYSNLLVSQGRIDAMASASNGPRKAVFAPGAVASPSTLNTTTNPMTPRPPPSRKPPPAGKRPGRVPT